MFVPGYVTFPSYMFASRYCDMSVTDDKLLITAYCMHSVLVIHGVILITPRSILDSGIAQRTSRPDRQHCCAPRLEISLRMPPRSDTE